MKLRIKADGVRLCLWFPLSILKTRLGYKVVQRAVAREVDKRSKTTDIAQQREQAKKQSTPITREQVKEMYNILKRCIKLNGHFNIVEVETHDGEKVLIRV